MSNISRANMRVVALKVYSSGGETSIRLGMTTLRILSDPFWWAYHTPGRSPKDRTQVQKLGEGTGGRNWIYVACALCSVSSP